MSATALVAFVFRHEYGRLVATLARRVGFDEIEAVEDAVQHALLTALSSWTRGEVPDDPSAWLFRVAHNELMDELRKRGRQRRILDARGPEAVHASEAPAAFLAGEVEDDMLRMLFVCCDETMPAASQLILALKTLCGFDVREISIRLFISEANVYKRLARARQHLRVRNASPDALAAELTSASYASRLDAVRQVLHLLFTEGYLSSHAEQAIRRELCEEAIRLATMLAEHPVGARPETAALVALMHLHVARMGSRQDGSGGLLLLEEQDRARWDQRQIATGLEWLAASAEGDVVSRFHAEAGIAAEHCLAPSFDETRWDRIVDCYVLLESIAPSALYVLNRAVAMAAWKGPAAGLAVLAGLEPPTWLAGSYQWSAVLADLHRRAGHEALAARHKELALDLAPNEAVRALLARRLRASA